MPFIDTKQLRYKHLKKQTFLTSKNNTVKNEIFIALDDFESPNALARYGAHLAKDLGRNAFLYGVTRIPLYTPPVIMTDNNLGNSVALQMKELKLNAENKIQTVSSDIAAICPDVQYDIGIGLAETTILSKIKKQDPYMFVLKGSNELTNLNEWFGTYETRLAEKTNVPALVVPENYTWTPINKILYIMDLDDQKVENMRFLTELSKSLNARLEVVTLTDGDINKDDERYLNMVNVFQALLGYMDIAFHRIFVKEPTNTITKIMEESNINMLAFESKSRSFLERMMDDYNTKHLILQSDQPVLVF